MGSIKWNGDEMMKGLRHSSYGLRRTGDACVTPILVVCTGVTKHVWRAFGKVGTATNQR